LLGGTAVGWPLAARAQQPNPVRRIGVLLPYEADDREGHARLAALQQGLAELGWSDAAATRASTYVGAQLMSTAIANLRRNWSRGCPM